MKRMFTSNVENGYESCTPGIATIHILHVVLGFVIKVIVPAEQLASKRPSLKNLSIQK